MQSTFRHEDYKWLTQLFPRREGEAVYSDSWFYVTQACRRESGSFGTYFRSENFFVGIGVHRNHWVLVRPIGLPSPEFFHELESMVAASSMSPRIFIKKASADFLQSLEDSGLSVVNADEYPWDITAHHDDDTFAEPIVNVKESLELLNRSGSSARGMRSILRRFGRLQSKLSFRSIHESGEGAVLRMIVDHFDRDPQNVNAYLNIVRTLDLVDDARFGHFVAHVDEVPVAFFAYEIVDSKSAGVYASVALRQYPGCGEFMMFHLFQELADRNIEFVNLGGSERQGLATYKRKFGPADERKNNIAIAKWEVERRKAKR